MKSLIGVITLALFVIFSIMSTIIIASILVTIISPSDYLIQFTILATSIVGLCLIRIYETLK